MWSSLNAPRTQGKLEAWAAYDYSHTDLQAGPNSGSAHMNTVAVGGDMKVSDRMLVGAMFGYTDNKGDFGGPGGGYTLRQPVAHDVRRLWRRAVVRRRDAGRRQPRLLGHQSPHPAGRRRFAPRVPKPAATNSPGVSSAVTGSR